MRARGIAFLTAFLALAVSASAIVTINWGTSVSDGAGRIYNQNGTAATSNRLVVGSVVQLIWSATNVASALNPLAPLVPTGPTEVVITNSTIGTGTPNTAGGFGFTFDVANGRAAGYVYTRAFNTTTTPIIGNFYYQSGVSGPLGLTTADPLTVNAVDPTPGGAHVYTNIEIIPEPLSAGLGLVGLAAIAWRRARRRRD